MSSLLLMVDNWTDAAREPTRFLPRCCDLTDVDDLSEKRRNISVKANMYAGLTATFGVKVIAIP